MDVMKSWRNSPPHEEQEKVMMLKRTSFSCICVSAVDTTILLTLIELTKKQTNKTNKTMPNKL